MSYVNQTNFKCESVSDFQYQMLPSGEKTTQGVELMLLNVSRLDSGTYFCRASNGVDRAVEANIQLKVICECTDKNIQCDSRVRVQRLVI